MTAAILAAVSSQRGREVCATAQAASANCSAQGCIGNDALQRHRPAASSPGATLQRRCIGYGLAAAPPVVRDDRQAARQRLGQHHAVALVERRQDEHVGTVRRRRRVRCSDRPPIMRMRGARPASGDLRSSRARGRLRAAVGGAGDGQRQSRCLRRARGRAPGCRRPCAARSSRPPAAAACRMIRARAARSVPGSAMVSVRRHGELLDQRVGGGAAGDDDAAGPGEGSVSEARQLVRRALGEAGLQAQRMMHQRDDRARGASMTSAGMAP